VDSESAVSLAELSPGHSVGAKEEEGSKLPMTRAVRTSCSPGEMGEQVQRPPDLLFQWQQHDLFILLSQSLEMEVLEKRRRQRRPERQ